ncbi:hypothetical protein [Amycolatopsis sacchari]|uniref:hypothetical protein n=1 Tax=Amycolatopsis sacchari TaxID=115433 RepID=UPI000B8309CB|nr:hypothetical protein [Amycolatopsis sacchari]
MISNVGDWLDPTRSWCAKAERARVHIESLREQIDDFRRSNPYTLTPELTDYQDRVAYVLRYHRDVPPSISTTVGDVLHNLRGALENLAFELAQVSHGRALSDKQEASSKFPICESPSKFDRVLHSRLAGLFNDRARAALRAVQPFALLEQAHHLGVAVDQTYEDHFHWDPLHRLDLLWNIDKHRRLAVMAWWPHFFYWVSDGSSNRRMLQGDGTLANGSVLFYMEGHDEGISDDVVHEFNLVLKDDPSFPLATDHTQDVLDTLDQFRRQVADFVFMNVATIMSR